MAVVALCVVAGVAAALYVLRQCYVEIRVDGQSMAPTLRDGERLLVRRWPRVIPQRGQVVVIRKPEPGGIWRPSAGWRPGSRHILMVKRVVAVPGDPVPPEWRQESPAESWGRADSGSPRVRDDNVVVLGDNRAASYDSRQFGPVPAASIIGVAVRRRSAGG
ncbi:signal peptidase I [Micromonospora viridifaciens]|uniref:Signal peptidase I n=1 Tax=Micromonospora viridifaciens TaxID=1881 RepID=A0A1C4Z198_MICVI|nr:signal peptidase I [Micromonospora viridifaciens]SCF26647.1 signal peptidase I [Micromonospora viridifaciens]